MEKSWSLNEEVDQSGRVAVVTGANSGLGEQVALELVNKGAHVVLACRSKQRAEEARKRIRSISTSGQISICELELADLHSVRAAADQLLGSHKRIDLLINNAGVALPPFSKTVQGVELQMAVNHLGHFLLTGLLMDRLKNTVGSRVINLTSLGHFYARDIQASLMFRGSYKPFRCYAESKLANLLFTFELHNSMKLAKTGIKVLAAHPGATKTHLFREPFNLRKPASFMRFIPAQSVGHGALPVLRAALDSSAVSGQVFGPAHFFQLFGCPKPVLTSRASHCVKSQKTLWRLSEEMTDFCYQF